MTVAVLFSELTPEILQRFPEVEAKTSCLTEPLSSGKGMLVRNNSGEVGVIYGLDSKYPYKSVLEMLDKCLGKGFRNLSVTHDRHLNKDALQVILTVYNRRHDLSVAIVD